MWEITWAYGQTSNEIRKLLLEKWEPYAVAIRGSGDEIYYFRRQVPEKTEPLHCGWKDKCGYLENVRAETLMEVGKWLGKRGFRIYVGLDKLVDALDEGRMP